MSTRHPELENAYRWAAAHQSLLEATYRHFWATGRWPELDELQRRFEQSGSDVDVGRLAWSMPNALGFPEQGRLVLRVRGLSTVPAAVLLISAWGAALAVGYQRYRDEQSEPTLSHRDVLDAAGGDERLADRVARLLYRESWAWSSGRGGPDDHEWTWSLGPGIRVAREGPDPTKILVRRDELEFPPPPDLPEADEPPPSPPVTRRVAAWLARPQAHVTIGQGIAITIACGLIVGFVLLLAPNRGSGTHPATAAPITPTDPIAVTVQADPTVYERGLPDWTSAKVVIPQPFAKLPQAPRRPCRNYHDWALALGGGDARSSSVRVTIQARRPGAILLRSIEVHVLHRGPPMRGTVVRCQAAGGAAVSLRRVRVDLDADPPTAVYLERDARSPSRAPLLSLRQGDTEVLQIEALTRTCTCEWQARLIFLVDGKERGVEVDGGSHPLRSVAPAAGDPTAEWRGRWRETS